MSWGQRDDVRCECGTRSSHERKRAGQSATGRSGSDRTISRSMVGQRDRLESGHQWPDPTTDVTHCSDFLSDDPRLEMHGKHTQSDSPCLRTSAAGPAPPLPPTVAPTITGRAVAIYIPHTAYGAMGHKRGSFRRIQHGRFSPSFGRAHDSRCGGRRQQASGTTARATVVPSMFWTPYTQDTFVSLGRCQNNVRFSCAQPDARRRTPRPPDNPLRKSSQGMWSSCGLAI